MLRDINIDQACDTIAAFAQANQVDHLTGIEYMVRYYNQLSRHEQVALTIFMAETAPKAKVDTKIIS